MPKFYCEYCSIYLTHSSPAGRKQHAMGKKHINAKVDYYQRLVRDRFFQPPPVFNLQVPNFGAFQMMNMMPMFPPFQPNGVVPPMPGPMPPPMNGPMPGSVPVPPSGPLPMAVPSVPLAAPDVPKAPPEPGPGQPPVPAGP